MVHLTAPSGFVTCSVHDILIHKTQQHPGACVANSTSEPICPQATHFHSDHHANSFYILWTRHVSSTCSSYGWCSSSIWLHRHVFRWRRRTVNSSQEVPICTFALQSRCSETWSREWQYGCQRTSSTAKKGGGEFISALYNLIHGFISSDESMTDIQ